MQWRSGNELRELFLRFFQERDHRRFRSFSLVPDDPSILFTIAGMVPFKPYFLGRKTPDFSRATTSQKCVRTNDIDNVGFTARHHTFFEMLGNFSFGDYFKSGAARFAWDFLTEQVGLDPDRLYPTIFRDDDEAFDIWNSEIGVPAKRIYRMGEEDNFWSVGPVGPCGPCSELIYDQGPAFSCGKDTCDVGCDCDRYLEIWNLVFMQYNRDENGDMAPLPKQNIDTGMGLERLASVVQQVNGDFETDLFKPLIDHACSTAGVTYGANKREDIAVRVIADHFRATCFMIADGVLPSNEGQGYVLRRILRRAVRFGRLLGIDRPFLMEFFPILCDLMGEQYTEIPDEKSLIEQVVTQEEKRFGRTLEQGSNLLENEMQRLGNRGEKLLPGSVAFELYDTFGFPYELTEEICSESGVEIERKGFEESMEIQRDRARRAAKHDSGETGSSVSETLAETFPATVFEGYVKETLDTVIIALISEGKPVLQVEEGSDVDVVLETTPFYAEMGGQLGDRGVIECRDFRIAVHDTTAAPGGVVLHRGTVERGRAVKGAGVTAAIVSGRRAAIKRHHTATHMVHEALGRVLGAHVRQAGSLVGPDLMRFDFTHMSPMSKEEIGAVESIVNENVLSNIPLQVVHTSLDKAREMGARALFDEKYGDEVRVVMIPGYSTELCGGTHVDATGDIGLVKILREEGIGSGVRRITAVAGMASYDRFRHDFDALRNLEHILGAAENGAQERIDALSEDNRRLRAENERLVLASASSRVNGLVEKAREIGGINLVTGAFTDVNGDVLRQIGDQVKNRMSACVVLLASDVNGQVQIVAMADDDAVSRGAHAGNLVRECAPLVGGGGGGRPGMAQAGGKKPENLQKMIDSIPEILENSLSG